MNPASDDCAGSVERPGGSDLEAMRIGGERGRRWAGGVSDQNLRGHRTRATPGFRVPGTQNRAQAPDSRPSGPSRKTRYRDVANMLHDVGFYTHLCVASATSCLDTCNTLCLAYTRLLVSNSGLGAHSWRPPVVR